MEMKMLLSKYLEMGGTLETLHKSGASIIDDFNQPPFEERKVGRISILKSNGFNTNGIPQYTVIYASGAKRETLSEPWIWVKAKVKLDLE